MGQTWESRPARHYLVRFFDTTLRKMIEENVVAFGMEDAMAMAGVTVLTGLCILPGPEVGSE